jgi:hypothetical protein
MTETTVTLDTTPELPELPGSRDAGVMSEWPLPVSDSGEILNVTGKFLGVGSSWRRSHSNHRGDFATSVERCRACRWFEARIFRFGEDADGDYLVYNVGQSVVPGETPRYTVKRVSTADEVLEQLTRRDGSTGAPSVSLPAEIVLSLAAKHDFGIHKAYVNHPLA